MKNWMFLLWLAIVPITSIASTLEEAKSLMQQKRFGEARQIYLDLANQGDVKAQYNLGMMYHDGDGVPADLEQAVNWYSKAAENGLRDAQYILAAMVFRRDIHSISYPQAVALYTKAAEQGHAKSQLNLGMLYYRGDVVDQDIGTALKWLKRAAAQDNSEAEGYLGNMFAQGVGVEQNKTKALMWLILAVENTDKHLVNRHTKMLNYVVAQMTEQEVSNAKQQAALCKSSGFATCD